MSEGHILFKKFFLRFSRKRFLIPHLILLPLFCFLLPRRRSVLFLAGDLTQWHLPVGMKDLNLYGTNVTGKTTSE